MNERPDVPSAEQQMYWREFVQLKADIFYLRDYRNSLNPFVDGEDVLECVGELRKGDQSRPNKSVLLPDEPPADAVGVL